MFELNSVIKFKRKSIFVYCFVYYIGYGVTVFNLFSMYFEVVK